MPPFPKKAATVILLREKESGGFEVFLVRRHEKSSFMAGNFVYPGGRVDPSDGSPEISACSKGLTSERAHVILGRSVPPEECLAYWVAGIRELFEEAGILFAYDQQDHLIRIKSVAQQDIFSSYRDLLQKGKVTLWEMARKERLSFALDHLHYYTHWITPEAQKYRFNTRFFLARHPAGQEASFDHAETTAGRWLTPKKALEENLTGDVFLSPPTVKTLEDLSRFTSIEEVFTSSGKNEAQTILPILTNTSEESFILFPWDLEYEAFQRGEIPVRPNHGVPSRPGDNTTRVVLREGRWLPYCRIK